MRKKKLITLAVAGMMVFTSIPMSANAASQVVKQEENSNKETQEALEKVILIVKERISIPKECTEFNYDYNTYNYGNAEWNLRWNDKKQTRYVSINCDSKGNITDYRDDNYENKEKLQLKYLKSELEPTALEYLNKIYPDLKGHFQLVSSGYNGTYNNSYYYTYERVENKIAMPDNTVTISISVADKSLKSIQSNIIFDVDIPDAKKEISKEKAIDLLKKKLTMSLGYYNKVETLKDGSEQLKAYLAYTPNLSYVAVDAKTGEIYTERSEWKYTHSREDAKTDSTMATADTNGKGLTQEEISKIDEISGLISKEEAIAKITKNKYLLLDNSAKAITATLTQQTTYLSAKEEKKTDYYWNINFQDPRKPDYENNDLYRANANARIDAKTGEIISYYASTKSDNEISSDLSKYKSLYTDKKCKQIFETFVSTVNKDRFKETKLVDSYNDYVVAYNDKTQIIGGLGYRYSRFNQDVEYNYNYICGDVDKVTGKVYSYSYNWDENVVFESKEGVISADEAYEAFMKLDGFDVVYEYNTINTYNMDYEGQPEYYYTEDAYSVDYEVRLVYSIEGINPKIISPFTKKQLDYSGEEYNESKENITEYTDINNSPYQRSIQLLTDIGLGYTSSRFNPTGHISTKDLITFSQAAGIYFEENSKKEVFDQYYVNRQIIAKYLCYILKIEDIASLPGIFTSGYADEASIQKEYIGYVAITKGLSLLTGDSEGKFNPQQKITRGEAADLLIQLIQR